MGKIKEISILVSASIIAALAVNYFSPAGIALVGQWDSSQGVITANEKNDIVHNDLEIGDVALAKKLYDSQKFTFVDARSRDDMMNHIKGAVSLITALSINLIRGHEFDCGCFSINSSTQEIFAWQLIIRDFLILALGIHIFLYRSARKLCILR